MGYAVLVDMRAIYERVAMHPSFEPGSNVSCGSAFKM